MNLPYTAAAVCAAACDDERRRFISSNLKKYGILKNKEWLMPKRELLLSPFVCCAKKEDEFVSHLASLRTTLFLFFVIRYFQPLVNSDGLLFIELRARDRWRPDSAADLTRRTHFSRRFRPHDGALGICGTCFLGLVSSQLIKMTQCPQFRIEKTKQSVIPYIHELDSP